MDRRFIWAMALMTLIVMAPAVLMKKPPAPVSAPADSVATVAPVPAPAPDLGAAAALPPSVAGPAEATPEDTVLIHTALATYGISTRGARLVTAALEHYRDQAPGQTGRPRRADAARLGADGAAPRGRSGHAAARRLAVQPPRPRSSIDGPTTVEFTATRGDVTVSLVYTFRPDDYQIGVGGSVTRRGAERRPAAGRDGSGAGQHRGEPGRERAVDGVRDEGPEHEVQVVPVARYRRRWRR